jgi:hypothetical protein
VFSLKLVDKAAVGYSDAWQSPGGKSVDTVTVADYAGTGGIAFECQTTSAALTASANSTDDSTPATMCNPEVTTTIVGVTSYTLDATVIQDPHISLGISAYLFEWDTREAYFYLGYAGPAVPPAAIGRVTLTAGAIGGEVRVTLTADVSLPVTQKPDLWVGNATTKRVILGGGANKAAAKNGDVFTEPTVTASDSTNAAKLTPLGYIASPTTAWTTGQKITVSGYQFNWSGTAWAAGTHAVRAADKGGAASKADATD